MTAADQPGLVRRYLPITQWLPGYKPAWLTGDLVAGLTVWALVVPESLAYAGLAGVPVQYGLYSIPIAALGYVVFGTSRQLFVGPSSTVAALSAALVAPYAASGSDDFIALTAALALLIGVFYLIAGFLRMGFVAKFFAKPVLDGFITGLGLFIIAGQLPKVVGIESPGGNTVSKFIRTIWHAGDWSWTTVVVGGASLALLFLLGRFVKKAPGALIVAVLSILAVMIFDLADEGVHVVGSIPTGFDFVSWDALTFDNIVEVVPAALGVLVVGFAQSVAIAKAYGARYHYRTDPNQEMIGYGVANIGAGILQGFTVTGSLSKSAAGESAGGRTPIVSVVVAIASVVTILFIAPVFENLAEATLGAIVIHAVWGMVKVEPLVRLWRAKTLDFWLALGALLGVILVGILSGIIIGVVLSLILYVHRTDEPHVAILGRDEVDGRYADIARHPEYRTEPGLLVYRWHAPLMFSNADRFLEDLTARVDEADPPLRAVVVDCETMFDIDTTGTDAVRRLLEALHGTGVDLHLAHLHGPVRDFMDRLGVTDLVEPNNIHRTVREAVEAVAGEQPG